MPLHTGSSRPDECEELREMARRARRVADAIPTERDRRLLLDFALACERDACAVERLRRIGDAA